MVGTKQQDIIGNFKLLWQRMKAERGCDACMVKDSCSKCLFPYPLDSKEYCQMRKSKHLNVAGVTKLLKLLKIIRKIRYIYGEPFERTKLYRVEAKFDTEYTVVNINRKKYLYQQVYDLLFEGSDKERREKVYER